MFSIIIPTYNDNLLDRAIKSILYKNYPFGVEVIVINDGGNELEFNTVINKFNDNRIIHRTISNSGGPAKPRNIGISLASFDYILLLDSDDYWVEGKLDFLFELLRKDRNIDFVWHNARLESGKIFRKNCYDLTSDNLLKHGNFIVLSTVCIKRNSLEGIVFNESQLFHGVEDYDFWIRLTNRRSNFKSIYIDVPLTIYNDIGEQHLSNRTGMTLKYARVFLSNNPYPEFKVYYLYRMARYYSYFNMNKNRRGLLYRRIFGDSSIDIKYRIKSLIFYLSDRVN
jgi:glycosyltransferase involved in cell wall biosynthesis